jgi:integrase
MAEGIETRHSRACSSREHGGCNCKPSYQAQVWSKRDKKVIKRTFPSLAAAKGWRSDATSALKKGTLRAPSPLTIREAWDSWFARAQRGEVLTRSGEPYKPSALQSYDQSMRNRVLVELGGARLTELTRPDVRAFANRLIADGLDPSTIRNTIMPLRVVYRDALNDDLVAVNPCQGIQLPAVRGRRDRIASPEEAAALIAAVPAEDRALWATAFYSGLRRGELMALRWEDVDFPSNLIRVERSYDPKAHEFITPKSKAGTRRTPIAEVLRPFLLEHRLQSGRATGLVFGKGERPFDYWRSIEDAKRAWKDAELNQISLHEARHTFASLMIAAGVNTKALSTFMGHSSITMTLDRYGHLMPGSEDEAAALLDSYLNRATVARQSGVVLSGS